jgi:hypothetical protein
VRNKKITILISLSFISFPPLHLLAMDIKKIKTLGQLKKSGYQPRSIKEEIRNNLITSIRNKENPFEGILGYEDTVIPDTERLY